MNQPAQQQDVPGVERKLDPPADHGEDSYRGSGRLQDKVAIITGGDSGIGRAVALAYAREGADVLVSYLSEDEDAHETRRLVESAGRRCELVPGDIADPAHCRAIVQKTVDAFGRIDILVNNAAYQMSYESLEEIPDDKWDYTFQVNITAMFHLCKAAVPHMKPGASIINTSSINSDKPKETLLPYAATKGGVKMLTKGMAIDLGRHGIQVNGLGPGYFKTELTDSLVKDVEFTRWLSGRTPSGRWGEVDELGGAAIFLASDASSFVNGHVLYVDGGITASL